MRFRSQSLAVPSPLVVVKFVPVGENRILFHATVNTVGAGLVFPLFQGQTFVCLGGLRGALAHLWIGSRPLLEVYRVRIAFG